MENVYFWKMLKFIKILNGEIGVAPPDILHRIVIYALPMIFKVLTQYQIINTNCFLKNTKYARIKNISLYIFITLSVLWGPCLPREVCTPPLAQLQVLTVGGEVPFGREGG